MRGVVKHFKKQKTCLSYHSSGGIIFPDLWSLACNSLTSNSPVPASKAAQHLYFDENIFNSQLHLASPSARREKMLCMNPGTERGNGRKETNIANDARQLFGQAGKSF